MSEQLAVQDHGVVPHHTGRGMQTHTRMQQWRLQVIHIPGIRRREAATMTLQARLREWHKRLGLFAFAFMGWLGASGILLNQSVSLGLDASRVDWGWLIGMYGLHAEVPKTGFASGDHWLVATTEKTVLDGTPLAQEFKAPLGFVAIGQGDATQLYVAAADNMLILAPDGSVVDQLSDYSLPVAGIRRIGTVHTDEGSLVAVQDLDIFVTRDGLSWSPLPLGSEITWSQAEALPAREQEKVLPYARPSIAIEQVLIDAHSGRLFGRMGPWVINAVGFAAVMLSVSGFWMVMRTNRRRRQASRG